jgi:hypothetical protein
MAYWWRACLRLVVFERVDGKCVPGFENFGNWRPILELWRRKVKKNFFYGMPISAS